MLRNYGLLVGGETVEEAFWLSRNVMTGINTQVPVSSLSVWSTVCVCLRVLKQ